MGVHRRTFLTIDHYWGWSRPIGAFHTNEPGLGRSHPAVEPATIAFGYSDDGASFLRWLLPVPLPSLIHDLRIFNGKRVKARVALMGLNFDPSSSWAFIVIFIGELKPRSLASSISID